MGGRVKAKDPKRVSVSVLDMLSPKRRKPEAKAKREADVVVVSEAVVLSDGSDGDISARSAAADDSKKIRLKPAARAKLYRPCCPLRPEKAVGAGKKKEQLARPTTVPEQVVSEAEEKLLQILASFMAEKMESKHELAHLVARFKDYLYRRNSRLSSNLHWEQKYRPRDLTKYRTGNSSACEDIHKWLVDWGKGSKSGDESDESDWFEDSDEEEATPAQKRGLLLVGPPGCGKTATISALASKLGLSIVEVNSSERRTGLVLKKKIMETTQSASSSTSGGGAIIVVEEIDTLFEERDQGFLSALAEVLRTTKRPMLMTSNQSAPPCIVDHVNTFQLEAPTLKEIFLHSAMIQIAEEKESLTGDFGGLLDTIREFVERRGRDYRAQVNDLCLFGQQQPQQQPKPEIKLEQRPYSLNTLRCSASVLQVQLDSLLQKRLEQARVEMQSRRRRGRRRQAKRM
jgi:hypothetical protein